jgi:hypothetical protein
LGCGGGVDGGHQTFSNAVLVVDDLHGVNMGRLGGGRKVTLARGARQFVVQLALEMTWYSDL